MKISKVLLMVITVLGPATSFAAFNQAQEEKTYKQDMVDYCLANEASLSLLVTDPEPLTETLCRELVQDIWSFQVEDGQNGVGEVIFLEILMAAGNKPRLNEIKSALQNFEKLTSDGYLSPQDVINRHGAIKMIERFLK